MPTLASVRYNLCALLCGIVLLTAIGAGAQDLPASKITGDDLRQALIWTGHYSTMREGDPVAIFHDAINSWQKSKGYPSTETLQDEQVSELLADGAKQRDAFGWTTLEDKSIGFSIGVPTKLVKFLSVRSDNGSLVYDFEGSINYVVVVRYGDLTCNNIDTLYARMVRIYRASYRARHGDWYAMAGENNGDMGYLRAVCRTAGVVVVGMDIATSQAARQGLLFSAVGDSLRVNRSFNPTAIPRPKIEPPTPTAGDLIVASATQPASAAKPSGSADGDGKTDEIKLEVRGASDLSVEQVFEKASAAVYMVKAGDRMGSAVAIGDRELLTNCHVVKNKARVTLIRDKREQPAAVVSVNEKADRCVLRTETSLPKWVTVRPYDDIKVGERAVTIGTPQGLELTVAEGIVSSKRLFEGRRLVQTTAPISPGSSGGGLFDIQGHLLGITTFHLKVGQNLNFAVAAEDFAKSKDANPASP